jgi:hypothetical protein
MDGSWMEGDRKSEQRRPELGAPESSAVGRHRARARHFGGSAPRIPVTQMGLSTWNSIAGGPSHTHGLAFLVHGRGREAHTCFSTLATF